jgi:hypothetical protein
MVEPEGPCSFSDDARSAFVIRGASAKYTGQICWTRFKVEPAQAERQIRWAGRMNDLSKAARKAIHDAAGVAYERELAGELQGVAKAFSEWKAGRLNAFDVAETIHDFHQGASRELFRRYEAGTTSLPDFALAGAVIAGFMKLDEIAPAGREHIAKLVDVMSADRATRQPP